MSVMVRVPLGPLTVRAAPASRLIGPAGVGGGATTVPLWMMLPFGSGKLLMVQEFTEKMPIGVIWDGGWFVGPKVADPVSVVTVLTVPVTATLTLISRPSAIDPIVPFALPESCAETAAGRLEGSSVHAAPLGSIETVARLLTKPPICTTTGMKHPVTPGGIVNWMTSQAAIPSGAGKFGSSPSQHMPRPAETTVA